MLSSAQVSCPSTQSMRHALSLATVFVALLAFGLAGCAAPEPAATFVPPTTEPVSIVPLPPLSVERPPESQYPPLLGDPGVSPTESAVALGKYLFFDSALSGDQKLSCATCHHPDRAWTDGLALSQGYPASLYFRNTPSLLNAGAKPRFYWDGRMADLATLVRDHIAEAHFMNADGGLVVERLRQKPQYVALFGEAFGGDPSYGNLLNAIATYVASLNSPSSAYDPYQAADLAALSPLAQQGLALFDGEAGCSRCHFGPLLMDGLYHNLGVPENPEIFLDPLRHITFRRFFRTLGVSEYASLRQDVGLYALTQEPRDRGFFLTPSLREVGLTAPYLHNGMFQTLEQVVAFYNGGGGQGSELRSLGLSSSEQAALVAFLQTLTSDLPEVEVPLPPAYQLLNLGEGQ